MREKEKLFICFLALIVSISILFIIIFNFVEFSGIRVKILGSKILESINKYQCEKINEDHYYNNIEQLVEYQTKIKSTLGSIETYKFIGNYKNDSNGEIFISSLYDVEFSKYPNIPIRMNLTFAKKDNKLEIVDYKVLSENININSDVYKTIEDLNIENEIEEYPDINNSKIFASEIINYFGREDYANIYSMLTNELKDKGSENDFIKYLEREKSKCGVINDIEFYGYEISKNKLEYKLKYYTENSEGMKIFITCWITNNNNKKQLSGIKFSNYVW